MNDPVVVGSNCTPRVSDCPGLSVAGKVASDIENPTPLTVAEFTVTGAVPVELSVRACETGALMITLPKLIEVAFTVSAEAAAFSCSEIVLEVLPAVAVSVTDCALVTDAAFAVNVALVAAAGTVTEAGTMTELLLLARPTLMPPVGAAPDKVTVQVSASDPVMEVLPQEIALGVGVTATPAPLMFMMAVVALLVIVTIPV